MEILRWRCRGEVERGRKRMVMHEERNVERKEERK